MFQMGNHGSEQLIKTMESKRGLETEPRSGYKSPFLFFPKENSALARTPAIKLLRDSSHC